MAATLSGKVAIITGGARGLGKAFGERILKAGGKVNFVDLNAKVGKASVAELQGIYGKDRAIFTHCDVTNRTQLENVFESTTKTFGRLDIVANNAGIAPAFFDKAELCVAINLMAVINGTQLAFEHMEDGVVINTASMAGIIPVPISPVYAATKAGVVNLSRSCASMMPGSAVRVNALCPAFTDTNMVRDHLGNKAFKSAVESAGGVMEIDTVADGFMQLVEGGYNGAVMLVTPRDGIRLKVDGVKSKL